ncbi:hypothetical protein B7486_62845, partial [cyanobacterium TDX16]
MVDGNSPEGLVGVGDDLTAMALALFPAEGVDGTRQQIVAVAEQAIQGCDGAGIFVLEDGVAATVAASSALVVEVDQLQIDSGEGPCLDAASDGSRCLADDLSDDGRWSTFGPTAVHAGVRSVLAYPLASDRSSALNLYAALPASFTSRGQAQGQVFAALATVALAHAGERAADAHRSEHLIEALETRELIGQAQGILMERERITAAEAFSVLRQASQHQNVKLRAVA